MISRLTRYLDSVDLLRCGMTPRGVACGLHATAGTAWPWLRGLHVLYRGVTAIDWDMAVGIVAPTSATPNRIGPRAAYSADAGTAYVYGLRAVSPGGVEEANVVNVLGVTLDAAGRQVPPAAPHTLAVTPKAGGLLSVSWLYRPTDGQPSPAAFAVFSDAGTGVMDWDTPLATVAASPYVAGPYADGTAVAFGVRAVYADGGQESNTTTETATADAAGPSAIEAPTLVEVTEL